MTLDWSQREPPAAAAAIAAGLPISAGVEVIEVPSDTRGAAAADTSAMGARCALRGLAAAA